MTASPSGYDPNRIPLSIFSSKPTNPQEWSVASNELFSIHMGNGSFSRDYDFLFGKSGELLKPEELNAQQYLRAKSGELSTQGNNNNNNKSSNDLSPVKEDHDHEEPEKKNTIEERANDTANNAVEEEKAPPATAEVKKVIPMSPPRYSDGSGNSVTSFAFPV
ncbi:hypothetical protein M569_14340 [Genlisea aurea]|uniref:Uncharacterized protein n=1 Tax=Genlisea aurea TaxID=192259 RepID=S8DCE1_9LAMI|nr:hypothetical protein M569_14340 [Genlisea aurea]